MGLLETVCAWLGDDFKLDPQAGFELKTGTIRNIMTYIPTKFEIEFFRLGADEHDQERFARRRQLALPEFQIEAVGFELTVDLLIPRDCNYHSILRLIGSQVPGIIFPLGCFDGYAAKALPTGFRLIRLKTSSALREGI